MQHVDNRWDDPLSEKRGVPHSMYHQDGLIPEFPNGKPRILFVIPGEEEGSSMIFSKREIASLEKVGVIAKRFFLRSRTSVTTLFQEWLRFRTEIRLFQPDLIHAQYGTMTAFFCAMGTNHPIVVTYRGSDLNPCPSMPWLRSCLGRFLSQISALRARKIICVSHKLKRRLWWAKKSVYIIPTGVNTNVFYPRCQKDVRLELGWVIDQPVVLFNAGREPRVKRLDLAQRAIEWARDRISALRFVVLDGHVNPETIPILMNAADCLLVTSDWEGSPTIVQEAMACNLPIASVDVGDIRERLMGVSPSWIVSRNVEELGKAVVAALTMRCRSNGYEKAKEISLNNLTSQILNIYQTILLGK